MYMLSTMLTTMLAYYILCIKYDENKIKNAIISSIIIFLGLLTHYFFVFYAFFVCLYLTIDYIKNKKFKKILIIDLILLSGVLLFVFVYPSFIEHLFKKTSTGTSTLEYIKTFTFYRLYQLIKQTIKNNIYLLLIITASLFSMIFKKASFFKKSETLNRVLFIGLPAIISYITISIVSSDIRYIANITPFFAIISCYLIYEILEKKKTLIYVITTIMILMVSIFSSFIIKPQYLYTEYEDYKNIIKEYSKSNCVYLTENRNPSITQDLLQLINFDSVVVTNNISSDLITKDLDTDKATVVYCALYPQKFITDDLLLRFEKAHNYSSYEFLYSNGWSDVYLFK